MNKQRFFAAISAAAVLAGSVPAVKVSAEPLPPYPQWVPHTYTDALYFVNDYGAVRMENNANWQGIVCVVSHHNIDEDRLHIEATGDAELLSSSEYAFEWPDDSKVGDPAYPSAGIIYQEQLQMLGLTEEMRESGDYRSKLGFQVNVYKLEPGESAQISVANESGTARLTFECDENGDVYETDIFGWLPDCVTEYEAFRLSAPTISAQNGYIVFCSNYAGDGGYQIFPEVDPAAALYREVDYSEVQLPLICGGTFRKIMVYEPVSEGNVRAEFTENQEWMIGKQEPVHSYSADFEIAKNGDDFEITDLSWWKEHEHNTFYKDGTENGGDFYGCLNVPETFYGEPVEKAVITNIPNSGSVSLPDTAHDVEIRNCPYLNNFYISDNTPYFDTYKFGLAGENALFSKGLGKIICYPPNYFADKITLPEKTTAIGNGAFRDAVYLEEIVAENVTEIGEGAFEGCTGLKLYVSSDALPALREQLGEEFFASGNQLLPTAPEAKNWEYYCSLTDEQVLEEYKAYRQETGRKLDTPYIKNGIIYDDIVRNTNVAIAYGAVDPCTLLFDEILLSTIDPVYPSEEPGASLFGFPEDGEIRIDHWNDAPSVVHIADDRQDSGSAYDLMRRELTLYNSTYYKLYSEKGKYITWGYMDYIPEMVPGDANGDAQLTLNDAVAILQQQALPEKYPICASCADCADCDGNPGISGMDALAIQQADAGERILAKLIPVAEPLNN